MDKEKMLEKIEDIDEKIEKISSLLSGIIDCNENVFKYHKQYCYTLDKIKVEDENKDDETNLDEIYAFFDTYDDDGDSYIGDMLIMKEDIHKLSAMVFDILLELRKAD